MDEYPPHHTTATLATAPSPPPPTSSLSSRPPASPSPPARPQRRAATRALISLSQGYVSVPLDFESSSDTDPGARDEQTANDHESPAAGQRKASLGESSSVGELKQKAEQLSGRDTGAGLADSDGDSDGYVAGREVRRGAKRKHRRSVGARRKMMRLDRDDWKVIAGAKEGNGGGEKGKQRKKASGLKGILTREEMGTLLGFVSAKLDWEKAALALDGEEDGAPRREVKGESEENGMGESETASRDDGTTSAKSGEELRRCWNTDLSTLLLRIYK